MKDPKTRAGTRIVHLSDEALSVLNSHHAAMVKQYGWNGEVPPEAFVFSPSTYGGEPYSPDSVSRATKRIADECGIEMTPHMMRHWAATQLMAANAPVSSVAAQLGHADPSVTLRVYTSPPDSQVQKASAEVLGNALQQPRKPQAARRKRAAAG